jgi:aquaporin Z
MTPQDKPLHGAPFPPTRLHWKLYIAELAGTAILVWVGVSVVIVMFGEGSPLPSLLPSLSARRFVTGALFGSVGALVTISAIGRISGAHLNPAVTLAFWLEGKMTWRDAVSYGLAQVLGGIVGSLPLLAWGAMGRSIEFGVTLPGQGIPAWMALLGETGVTFLFVLAIFTIAAHPSTRRFTPLSIPVLFSLLVWAEASISGASANPARSLGPALIAAIARDQWIYVVGPLLGAALAIGFMKLQIPGWPRVSVARLFHFHLG